MVKTKNRFGQYVLTADNGMTLFNGEIYAKICISHENIDETEWAEVEDSVVPIDDELTDTEALAIIVGGEANA